MMQIQGYPRREMVERIKRQYPAGTRIRLHNMDDSAAVPPGTMGTVACVDDMGQLIMNWDNGRSLSLIPGVDSFSRVHEPKRGKGGDAR